MRNRFAIADVSAHILVQLTIPKATHVSEFVSKESRSLDTPTTMQTIYEKYFYKCFQQLQSAENIHPQPSIGSLSPFVVAR